MDRLELATRRGCRMKLTSLGATLAAFFLPSRSTAINAGKLALISMVFTTFFLFTAGYHFPGGAIHYPNWAEAIVHGTTLPVTVAQRDVGLPLLYILSGFTLTHSFIGITLLHGLFAVLTAVLVYWCLARASQAVGFFVGLLCIISLSPFTYLKFFYPDQAYMFFNLLAIALLIEFLWTGQFRMLYFFTVAALAASFTRTAGNLMFPVMLAIAYITVRGPIRHYLIAVSIFALGLGAYAWHRYEVFDMSHQASVPSGKGMQISYAAYLYMGDFGFRLTPDIGPNTKLMLEKLREGLQPSTRESPLIKAALYDEPQQFLEKHVYAYTSDELYELICTKPNEEYYWILYTAYDPNDEFHYKVAIEIYKAHPWYVVEYTLRNLWHTVFDPGYGTPRYSTRGYGSTGLEFMPATQGWGVRSEDAVTAYGPRAAREMEYFQLKTQPAFVQRLFEGVQRLWLKSYRSYVWITSGLIIVAWVGVLLGALCWAIPGMRFCRALASIGINQLAAPIIAVSALLLYEDLATAMFSQPHHRYFHITEPWRLVVAGFGLILITRLVSSFWQTRVAAHEASPGSLRGAKPVAKIQGRISQIQNGDLFGEYFSQRPVQWILLLVVVNVGLFAWWTSSMIAHAWGPAPVEIISATYGENCRDFVPASPAENRVHEGNVTSLVDKTCIFYRCDILVDAARWGDPAPGCAKDFTLSYRCRGHQGEPRTATVAAEAAGKTAALDCYAPLPLAAAPHKVKAAAASCRAEGSGTGCAY